MASTAKQRLIGAVILIAVLAIFIPLFMSPHKHIKPMDSKPPLPPKMPVVNLTLPPEPVTTTKTVSKPSIKKDTIQPVQPTQSVPVVSAKPVAMETKDAWRLKLGTFQYQKNSQTLIKRLKLRGFEAYSQAVTDAKGQPVYQVYIGPAVSKVEATQLKKHLLDSMQLPSIIVAYPK